MARHELHCTMNPKRECRMCEKMGEKQEDLSVLIPFMPNREEFKHTREEFHLTLVSFDGLDEAIKESIKKVRDYTDCPVCIFSALRQTGLAGLSSDVFDFKKELAETWKTINDEEARREMGSYR